MSHEYDCRSARLEIGGDPHAMSPALEAHLATCADCTRLRTETLALDSRLRSALELPLANFRKTQAQPAPARRYALAASVVLAVLVGGGFWLLRPQPALATDVLEHVRHEGPSWDLQEPLSPEKMADVLKAAGVDFDNSMPVVYASACPFHGRLVPHFVVETAQGPLTVMLLAHEKIGGRQEFSEKGFRGVLLPAGEGSVAVLARGAAVPEEAARQLVSGVRW